MPRAERSGRDRPVSRSTLVRSLPRPLNRSIYLNTVKYQLLVARVRGAAGKDSITVAVERKPLAGQIAEDGVGAGNRKILSSLIGPLNHYGGRQVGEPNGRLMRLAT